MAKPNETAWKVLIWSLATLISINVSILTFILIEVWDLEIRVSRIEANRFTSMDGVKLQTNIMDKLPPTWLLQRVERLERKMEDVAR